jgi:hypothetical protein
LVAPTQNVPRRRFLSSSLKRNSLFNSITNVPRRRFVSSGLQNNPLFAPIPHEYIRDKQKVLNVYFNINEVDQFLLFCTRIKSSID